MEILTLVLLLFSFAVIDSATNERRSVISTGRKFAYTKTIIIFSIVTIVLLNILFFKYATIKGQAGDGIRLEYVGIVVGVSALAIGLLFSVLNRKTLSHYQSTARRDIVFFQFLAILFVVIGFLCFSFLLIPNLLNRYTFIVLIVIFILGILLPTLVVAPVYLKVKKKERAETETRGLK